MNINVFFNKQDEVLTYAFEELARYINIMDKDINLNYVQSKENSQIILEVKDSLEAYGLPKVKDIKKDDQIYVNIKDGRGEIVGINSRSVLLAVYKLLNKIGCRFLRPGEKYEIVPSCDFSKVDIVIKETASFRHRGVCIEGADSINNIIDFIAWLPKVGFNSFFVQFENPYPFLKRWYEHEFNPYLDKEDFSIEYAQKLSDKVDEEMKKRGLLHHRVGHGWTGEVLGYSSKFGWESGVDLPEENKKFAAKLNGKRDLFNGAPILTSLCFSNSEVNEKMTDIIVDYAKKHTDVDYLHVWLSDARNNICECEECKKDVPADQYVRLLNLLDSKLEKEGLSTKICFLLYHELLWAPIYEKVNNKDRFVMMFAPITRTFETSYKDRKEVIKPAPYKRNEIIMPNSLEENLAHLFEWQKSFKGDSFVYDYPLGRAHYGDLGYVSISKTIFEDIKCIEDLGLNGYISCQELRAGFPTNLPNYIMGNLLWNKDLDYNFIVEEYFKAAYGEEWECVYEYLEKLSNLSSCDYFNAIGPRIDVKKYKNYSKVCKVVEEFSETIKENIMDKKGTQKDFWKVLSYHGKYSKLISKGLAHLCIGEEEEAQEMWERFLHYIRFNEPMFQEVLDVYRVIEVAKNYAGFKLVR